MFCGLELDVNISNLVCEDEVLLFSFDPGRFWSIFYFWDGEAGENEGRIDFRGVLLEDLLGVGHGIAKFSSLDR